MLGGISNNSRKKGTLRPAEQRCPACNGTGFPLVAQPDKPSRRIFPASCKGCMGKGRVAVAITSNLVPPPRPSFNP
jgi:DnaJ-class molecular chaperone